MSTERIRRAALPAARSVHSTLAAVLFVLTVAFGLLAMHDAAGGEHTGHGPGSSGAPTAASAVSSDDHATHASTEDGRSHPVLNTDHGPGDSAMIAGSDGATSSPPACSIAGPACAMAAAAPVTVGLATAPWELARSTAVVVDEPRAIRLGFVALPPPDLHLLSISRT